MTAEYAPWRESGGVEVWPFGRLSSVNWTSLGSILGRASAPHALTKVDMSLYYDKAVGGDEEDDDH